MSEQVEGQLTLFPADSPASRSPLPGSGEARKMTATSGRKWLGLSKNSGPLGLLEKMLLESSEWHSPIFYLSWKPVDIGQGHFLFQLVLSEPATGDTESLLWPTPTAGRADQQMSLSQEKRKSLNLAQTVQVRSGLWPTPTAQDAANSTFPASQIKRKSIVGEIMREQFATPQARDYRSGQASRWVDPNRSRNLNDQIAMFPTPRVGGSNSTSESGRKHGDPAATVGGQLNPAWVEWLMGFLEGWTEI